MNGVIAILGSTIVLIGVFLPIISIPIGSKTVFELPYNQGYLFVIGAFAMIGLASTKRYKELLLVSLVVSIFVTVEFFYVLHWANKYWQTFSRDLPSEAFVDAYAITSKPSLGLAWIPFFLGLGMSIYASWSERTMATQPEFSADDAFEQKEGAESSSSIGQGLQSNVLIFSVCILCLVASFAGFYYLFS
jgi:hypothetical protein